MRLNRSALAVTAAIGLAVAGGSAFTASNTVGLTAVGQGASVTSGFTVSAVDYTLGDLTTNADEVASVTFILTAEANTDIASKARVRLVDPGSYYECTRGTVSGQTVQFACTIDAGVTAVSVNTLDIVAVSGSATT